MVEEIGKIISKGFETFTKNLNLSIPFVLNVFVSGLLTIVILFYGLLTILGSSLQSLARVSSPDDILFKLLPVIAKYFFEIAALIALYFLISMFFQAFFMAGAIGMAKQAIESGKTDISTMIASGKKNVINLYLAEILVGLLYIAGIVFILPGAMKFGQLLSTGFMEGNNTGAVLLLFGGALLWGAYVLILNLVLALFRYALVIDELESIDGITAGFRFFNKHRFDVFLLWLIIGAVIFILAILGQIMGLIPIINVIWPFLSVLVSVLIIEPITTLWWVRLYMTRTGKKLYFNELLAHPLELEKLRANQ